MKKIFIAAIMLIVVLLVPSTISATELTRTRFYNFDDMLIDGTVKKPSGVLYDVRKGAEFKKLYYLNRRSFIKEMMNNAKELKVK
jgi:hypothetical protein